ncbi:MAG: HypC/HybG/HupF family hydrogenase formation chaperone [Actinomycetota bacterium]
MCLGVPGKVVAVYKERERADVDISGVVIEVGLQFVPDVAVGEYVLVHTGFAMHKMDEGEALETLELLEEMARLGEEADGQVS